MWDSQEEGRWTSLAKARPLGGGTFKAETGGETEGRSRGRESSGEAAVVTQARGAGGVAQAANLEGKEMHSSSRSDMGWIHPLTHSTIQSLPGSFIHSTDIAWGLL